MGKRGPVTAKRSGAAAGRRIAREARQASRPANRRWLLAALILALAAAGGVVWRLQRNRSSAPAVADRLAGAADAREAALLRAVQVHPSESRPHRELAEYYLQQSRPFEALWELALARPAARGMVDGAADVPLTLRTAEALKRAGLPEAALQMLSAVRSHASGQPSLDRAVAQLDLEIADPNAAAQVVRSDPPLLAAPEGRLLLARAYLAMDDLPAAKAEAERARQAAKKEPAETRLALGRLALAWGDVPAARADLAAAARADPGNEEAQYYAGLAYSRSGDPAGTARATEYFKAATRADPRQARGGVELGRLLFEKAGEWERAAQVYRQALALDPRCLAAEEGLARVRAALKQPAEVAYHQARLRELQSRPDEAVPLYRRWGELRPERWDSVLRAAECSMDLQRYMDAVREVQRGLKRYPANPELFGHLAQIYIRTGSRPEAARVCDQWEPVDRTSGRPEWVRGQLAAKALRDADAIRWYELAARKNPALGAYHAALGEQLASQPTPERLKRARAELEQATSLDPAMPLNHYQLGLVLQRLDDADGARRAFLRALDRDSDRLDAYAGVIAAARRAGRPDVAAFFVELERAARDRHREEAAARQAISIRPRDPAAHLRLARALLHRGRLAEARDHLQIAAEQPAGATARPLLQRVQRLLSVL